MAFGDIEVAGGYCKGGAIAGGGCVTQGMSCFGSTPPSSSPFERMPDRSYGFYLYAIAGGSAIDWGSLRRGSVPTRTLQLHGECGVRLVYICGPVIGLNAYGSLGRAGQRPPVAR